MWIRFRKPAPGYSYSEGDRADLYPEEDITRLIEEGYAIPLDESEVVSDLPDDFPARSLLIGEGILTLKQVADALPSLCDVKGIGENTLKKIVERLNDRRTNGI